MTDESSEQLTLARRSVATTQEDSISLAEDSHWLDIYGSRHLRESFHAFRLLDQSFSAFTILMLLFFLTVISSIVPVAFLFPTIPLTTPILVFLTATCVVLLLLTLLKVVRHYGKEPRKPSDPSVIFSSPTVPLFIPRDERILENLCYVMLNTCFVFYTAFIVVITQDFGYHGASAAPLNGLPEGLVVGALCFPCLLYMVMKSVEFRLGILTILLVAVGDLIIIFRYDLSDSVVRMVTGLVLALFMISEYHRQAWHSFQVTHRLNKTLVENARLAEEVKANELRHVIGNVAHDLKTPLSSFISGVDVIRMEAIDLQSNLSLDEAARRTKLCTIVDVAESITKANVFMTMTINRCIDYNKTLFGVQLIPRSDVFPLRECVDDVLRCLSVTPRRVAISVHFENATFPPPYSSSSPSFSSSFLSVPSLCGGDVWLRTDKQWLQENLLCLADNGVKFSKPEHAVNVRFSVTSRSALAQSLTQQQVHASSMNDKTLHEMMSEKTLNGPLLLIQVTDQGPGIAKELRGSVFEEPTQATRAHGGTGLGLYILAQRVRTLYGVYGVSHPCPQAHKDSDAHAHAHAHAHTHPRAGAYEDTQPDIEKGDSRDNGECTGCTFWFAIPLVVERSPTPVVTPRSADPGTPTPTPTPTVPISAEATPKVAEETASPRPREEEQEPPPSPPPAPALASLPPQSSVPSLAPQSSTTELFAPPHKQRVLVVDDSPLIRKMTAMALSKHGYTVETAEDGVVAVELFRKHFARVCECNCVCEFGNDESAADAGADACENKCMCACGMKNELPFDVVLMDFQMPEMDGITAMRVIKELLHQHQLQDQEQHTLAESDLVLIGFSAKSDDEQIEEARVAGMHAFLPKPFAIATFHSILSDLTHSSS